MERAANRCLGKVRIQLHQFGRGVLPSPPSIIFLEHPATAEIVKTTEGIFIPRELTSTPRSMCRGVGRTPIGPERRVAHWMRSWSVSMVRESAVTLSMQAELSNGYSGARQRQGEESAEL